MSDVEVRVRVPGKVNLALHVGPTDEQGYHELGTVFQAVSVYDDVIARPAPRGVFTLTISGEGQEWLPTDSSNLAIKAARLLAEIYGVDEGVELAIHKRIPISGGMAGGSADAAGTLLACSVLWGVAATPDDLVECAKRLGADVPFALLGGVAIGRGRGDDLVPVLTRGMLHWVFATSHDGLSTPRVFRRFDELSSPRPTGIADELLAALAVGDATAVGRHLTNDLAEAAIDLDPRLADVLATGRAAGAIGAVVSGSGPTCAFLVPDADAGLTVAHRLAAHPDVRSTHRAWGPVPGAQLRHMPEIA